MVGMSTMIGTPPNIIIANYRADISGAAFSMFDFSPIGSIIAVVGVIFISLIGWRLIPKKRFDENTPEQLGTAIRKFWEDEDLRQKSIKQNRNFVAQFKDQVIARQWMDTYHELAGHD